MQLKDFAQKGQFQRAQTVLRTLQKSGLLSVIHVNVVISAGRHEDWMSCLSLLEGLRPKVLHPTLVSFNSVLKVISTSHQWKTAADMMRQMHRNRISKDIITFNTILSPLKRGQWREAQALLESMPSASVAWDAFSISACLHPENWKGATRIVDQYNGPVDTAGFNSVIGLSHSRWRSSLQVLFDMPAIRVQINRRSWNAMLAVNFQETPWEFGMAAIQAPCEGCEVPDIISFNSAASACEKQRAWKSALKLFSTLRARGLQPEVVSCNNAIMASAKRPWPEILVKLDEMLTARINPDGASYIAAISGKSDDELAEVLLLHMSMAQVERDALLVGAFVSSCQSQGQWQQALLWLHSMSSQIDCVCCGSAISTFEKTQRWREAVDLCFTFLRDKRLRLDHLSSSAAISSCESSAWQLLLAFLFQTKAWSLRASQISYPAAMGACLSQGWERTINLFSHMTGSRLESDATISHLLAKAWAAKPVAFVTVLDTLSEQVGCLLSKREWPKGRFAASLQLGSAPALHKMLFFFFFFFFFFRILPWGTASAVPRA
eukprot:Skav213914  [mRNA]  locus=scaffold1439:235235:236881:- [translate_table: standard]